MEEENKIENQTKNNNKKTYIILCIILMIVLVIAIVFIIGEKSSKNKSNDNSNEKIVENNSVEENNKKNTDNEEKTIKNDSVNKLSEEEVKELYYKYHPGGKDEEIELTGAEERIYTNNKYDINEMTFFNLLSDYGKVIIPNTINRLNDDGKIGTEIVTSILKEEYRKYFGKNAPEISYSNFIDDNSNGQYIISDEKGTFLCHSIYYDGQSYKMDLICGGATTITAKYNLKSYEQKGDYLYLYEDVVITDSSNNTNTKYSYKWTFDLQEDGKYYFLMAERI